MKKLRYYQVEAQEALLKDFKAGKKSLLLQMATGTGKTFTTTSFIEKNQDIIKNVLWLTHREELIDQSALSLMLSMSSDEKLQRQIKRVFARHGDSYVSLARSLEMGTLFSEDKDAIQWIKENMGLIKRNINQYDKKVVVASVQTATRRINQLAKKHYDLVVIDEAHLALSKSWKNVCDTVPHKFRLGLTATPERMDGVAMDQLFDKISYVYGLKQGIDDKNLCEIQAIRVKTDINIDKVRTTAGELNNKDLAIVDCEERNQLICDKYFEFANGRKALVFAINIAHAMNITKMMLNNGIKADIVVSDESICPDKRRAIRKFVKGETEVLVNVDILTTGFDYPEIGAIILARPTKSRNLYIQIIGRGTRLKNQDYVNRFGQRVIVMDIVDVTSRHSLVNAYSLDYGRRIEDRVFITEAEREELLKERESQRESPDTTIDRITEEDVMVDLMALPQVKTADIERMDREEMTEKQRNKLIRLGYDVEKNIYTKGDAFQIIANQEASQIQIAHLKSMGYDTSMGATHFQYVEARNQQLKEYRKQREKWKRNQKKKKTS
jgi:superfamily II DNA or RNA helicase